MITRMDAGRLLRQAEEAGAHHKTTAFCEQPRTCGGCHFWAGYISALRDVISGQKPAPLYREEAAAELTRQAQADGDYDVKGDR